VTKNATIALKEKAFNIHFIGLLVYADKIPADGEYMEGVFVSDSRLRGEENIIIAKKAFVVADQEAMIVKLRMEDGSIHTVSQDLKNYRKIDFTTYDINLHLGATILAKFTDKYKEIEEMTISEIFEKNGEGYFRQLETLIMEEISNTMQDTVLSVGGGLPMTEKNHKYLKKIGKVIYLKVSEQTVIERLKGESGRPLLSGDDATEMIYRLLSQRHPTYQMLADVVIDTDDMQIEEVVDEIIRQNLLNEEGNR